MQHPGTSNKHGMIEQDRKAKSTTVARMMQEGSAPPVKGSEEWQALVGQIEHDLGRSICGTPRRNRLKPEVNGFPCERKPSKNGRCAKHGGKNAPPGPEHHSIKHGRYSKALGGTSLNDLYSAARRDPDLLALNDEIAILAAKLQQTLQRLNRGEDSGGREIWVSAVVGLRNLKKVLRRRQPDKNEVAYIIQHLQDVFEHGLNDYKVWEEWFTGVDALRKLVDTERKHRESQQLNLTVERGMLMLTIWAQAAQNVLSPDDASRLRHEIARLREATAEEEQHSGRNITRLVGAGRG